MKHNTPLKMIEVQFAMLILSNYNAGSTRYCKHVLFTWQTQAKQRAYIYILCIVF